MFDDVKLLGTKKVRFKLATKEGRNINNEVALPITEREKRIDKRICGRHGKRWVRRKEACGTYNCAGHVWASRRTTVNITPA